MLRQGRQGQGKAPFSLDITQWLRQGPVPLPPRTWGVACVTSLCAPFLKREYNPPILPTLQGSLLEDMRLSHSFNNRELRTHWQQTLGQVQGPVHNSEQNKSLHLRELASLGDPGSKEGDVDRLGVHVKVDPVGHANAESEGIRGTKTISNIQH